MSLLAGHELGQRLRVSVNSQVYRAVRESDGKAVILKQLLPLRPPPESLARFKREFETLRSLAGPGVASALALETDQSSWVLVMEDSGGESLDRLARRGDLPLEELLEIGVAAAEALDHVHARHVIHKDINPSNLVWNRETRDLRIIDFGLATVLSRENPGLRNPHVLEGTLTYISPEQTGRMNATVDFRADFYSLGVTLYELVTGRPPFLSEDPMELVHSHIAQEPVPPSELLERVPAALSGVVMKLLEKTPEERYQSTFGLLSDLRRCLDELRSGGEVSCFEPGLQDRSERCLIPQRLYGRAREVRALLGAFERLSTIADGATGARAQLTLVAGPAGIGKSALVQELLRPITSKRGYFISGKFEQIQRNTPYSAVVRAFRSLTRELLTEPEERLAEQRERLTEALGPNGRVVIDVIPEIERIIGPQPEVMQLAPQEERNRFNFVFRNFIRACARPAQPLVIFLDDLQWADSASLQLLELLLTDDEPQTLLLIGAYRDTEVGQTHPLTLALASWREQGVRPERIQLGPLDIEHIVELISDTVGEPASACESLAALIARNTEGNPLFVTEFLRTLHEQELITFDREAGRWRWDLAEIESRGMTDNILDLMIAKLRRLPESTQQSLCVAACVGNSFDLRTLADIREQDPAQAFATLLPAIQSGVLIATSELETLAGDGSASGESLRFFHDRVQQAAYALLEEGRREELHLRIGRLLLAGTAAEERLDKIFELVDQLNRGSALITAPAERLELGRMNLEAGTRARHATAYDAAVDYLDAGLELLPRDAWKTQYELSKSLHQELASSEFLAGNHERSDDLSRTALEHARSAIEKAEIHYLLANQCTMSARYTEALDTVHAGLELLGIELPKDDLQEAVGGVFQEIQENLGDVPVASLIDRETMSDPEICAATRLLMSGFAAAFYVDPFLYALMIFKAVNFALVYGHPPDTKDVYVYYGHLLGALFGRPEEAHEFGKLALALSKKAGRPQDECRSSFILANWILPYVEHLRGAKPINTAGFEAGLDSGELVFAGYILIYRGHNDFYCGKPLSQVLPDVREYLAWARKVRNTLAGDAIDGIALALANAHGETDDPELFDSDHMDDARYVAMCTENKTNMGLAYYYILKTQLLFLYGRYDEAMTASSAAEPLLPFILGNVAVAEHTFHSALVLAALHERASDEAEQAELWEQLGAGEEKLRQWMAHCPQNFSHMHALVSAEMCRLRGEHDKALEHYERAIDRAYLHEFHQDAAVANELLGRFWLRRDRTQLARAAIVEAHYRYRLWEAGHKVGLLEREFPWLTVPSAGHERTRSVSVSTTHSGTETLDLLSLMKASQAISGEIVVERLLERLMQLVLQSSGAQRGVLVLDEGDASTVQAVATAQRESGDGELSIDVLMGVPLAEFSEVPHGIVSYARRLRESVILDDAAKEGKFIRDEYVRGHGSKSILCAPLSNKGVLIGTLYLENGLAAGAFTEDRVEVLRVLASQFAISFENARLYEEMEQKVQARTRELAARNEELKDKNAEILRTQAQLIQVEKMASLGQLVAGVAHEINNPVNFISSGIPTLRRDVSKVVDAIPKEARDAKVDKVASRIGKLIDAIEEGAARTVTIVKDLRNFSRLDEAAFKMADVHEAIDTTLTLLRGKLGSNVEVVREYGDIPAIACYISQLNQVFMNLLTNAAQAIEGSGRITITTEQPDEDSIRVSIADTGQGISEEVKSKIFDPFFTTKDVGEGTGLGLAISHGIIEKHNGSIELESEIGVGTTFRITLPVSGPAEEKKGR